MQKSSSYSLYGYCGFTGRERTDAIIIECSKAFYLVPHDRLLMKTAATGVDLRVVVWVKKFLLGRSQRVRVDGQLSEEVRATSGVPEGSVGETLSLIYGCSQMTV